MTTLSWSSVIDHSTDAGFRTWGAELSGKFTAAGLVQTSDTGQINWGTVTRSGATNTMSGYEIYRFADSSLYLKVEYGNGAAATTPGLILTVGTGSDGAGALTGQTSTRTAVSKSATAANASTTTARMSYLCVTADYVGLLFKAQATTTGIAFGFFSVAKWVDSTGAAVTSGFICHYCSTSGTATVMSRAESVKTSATSKTWGIGSSFCLIPTGMTDSVVGSDNQIFLHFFPSPRVIPGKHVFSIFNSEAVLSTTFTATPVGATSHTFISLAGQAGLAGTTTSDDVGLAMLWE